MRARCKAKAWMKQEQQRLLRVSCSGALKLSPWLLTLLLTCAVVFPDSAATGGPIQNPFSMQAAALRQAAIHDGDCMGTSGMTINNDNKNNNGTNENSIAHTIHRRKNKNSSGPSSASASAASFFGEALHKGKKRSNTVITRNNDVSSTPRTHGADSTGGGYPEAIQVSGADLVSRGALQLDGVYVREWDVNGAPHFKRRKRGSRTPPVHLMFTGNAWMLHLDADADLDVNHCLAYSEVPELNPLLTTRQWAVRVGQAWVRRPHMRLARTTADADIDYRAKEGSADRSEISAGTGTDPLARRLGIATALGKVKAADARDMALTRELLPLYLVFILDAVGLGVALPVLPFFVMGLEATALQLAIVVSSNYIAQTFGCIITGNLSDVVGRKPVVLCCLLGTVVSNIMVARSTSLKGVAWGRIVGGITGGLTPIAQAAVADVVPVQSLPKFLGRIQACVGLGFVLGPLTMTLLHRVLMVSSADTFYAAAVFPLVGLLYALLRMPETRAEPTGVSQMWQRQQQQPSVAVTAATATGRQAGAVRTDRMVSSSSRNRRQRRRGAGGGGGDSDARRAVGTQGWNAEVDDVGMDSAREEYGVVSGMSEEVDWDVESVESEDVERSGVEGVTAGVGVRVGEKGMELIPRAVMLLVGNGFLLMYAFSIETIYAMFLKDNFGYEESVLSMVFALNGLAVGVLQLLGMRHLVRIMGKHMMLVTGNLLLASGMVGMALCRQPLVHFSLFTLHIMGYSLADTALVALISRYASPATQGRSLGLNQAAQSMSRVVSPVVAGVLYEWSKKRDKLPLGALPYLVGSAFPLVGVAVPFWLYLGSVEAKKRKGVYTRGGCSVEDENASVPPQSLAVKTTAVHQHLL